MPKDRLERVCMIVFTIENKQKNPNDLQLEARYFTNNKTTTTTTLTMKLMAWSIGQSSVS